MATSPLRCALCGRALTKPAAYIQGAAVGPECAQQAGLVSSARKPRHMPLERYLRQTVEDDGQGGLFEESENIDGNGQEIQGWQA